LDKSIGIFAWVNSRQLEEIQVKMVSSGLSEILMQRQTIEEPLEFNASTSQHQSWASL